MAFRGRGRGSQAYGGGGGQTSPVEEHLKFTVNKELAVTVMSGDITQMQADGVVVGENSSLTLYGYVAGAIKAAGGFEYSYARSAAINQIPFSDRGTDRMKRVYWCSAGPKLRYNRVYHAVVPMATGKGIRAWQGDLATVYTKVCAEADTQNKERSLVAPVLGSGGVGGGTFEDAAWAALNGFRVYHPISLKDIILVEKDSLKAKRMVDVCKNWIDRQKTHFNNHDVRILSGHSASGGPQGAYGTGSSGTGSSGTGSSGQQHQTGYPSPSSGHPGSGQGSWHSSTRSSRDYSSSHGHTASTRAWEQSGGGGADGGGGAGGEGGEARGDNLSVSATGGSTRHPSSATHHAPFSSYGGGMSRPRGKGWREPSRQEGKNQELGNYNYHMTDVVRRREEKERNKQEPKATASAMLFENNTRDGRFRDYTSGYHEEPSNSFQNGRDWSHDDRDISPMNGVEEEGGEHFPGSHRRSSPEPAERAKSKSNQLTIVHLSGKEEEEEESEDETSPDPAAGRTQQPGLGQASSSLSAGREAATRATSLGTDFPYRAHDAKIASPLEEFSSLTSPERSSHQGNREDFKKLGRSHSSESQTSFSSLGSVSRQNSNSSGEHIRLFSSLPSNGGARYRGSSGSEDGGTRSTFTYTSGAGSSGGHESIARQSSRESMASQGRGDGMTGRMPEGKMVVTTNTRIQMEGSNVLVIEYSFPNGVQGEGHPVPGEPYKGTFCRAFLPDNQEGQEVLKLLREAFDRKLTFRIEKEADGEAVVKYAGIPHLTSHKDPNVREYLRGAKEVLHNKYNIF